MTTPLPPTTWRLIRHSPAPGSWNMAVDEAILAAVGAGQARPTLRLYAWDPPCLSLGFAQSVREVDCQALQSRGWELVRRPTGGRAILHTDELTYAVIGPPDEPRLAGGILESYQRLAQALLLALHRLGLPVVAQSQYPLPPGTDPKGPVCFEVPSNYEITVGGKKLIGSAQARKQAGVLQHGSLPLTGDLTRITQGLAFSDEAARQEAAARLLERATTVETVLGRRLTLEQTGDAFIAAFEDALQLEFAEDGLTRAELEHARELVQTKYAHPSWTERI